MAPLDSLVEPFIGTWKLVSCLHRLQDGQTIFPLGDKAQGLLIYTREGYMSGALMCPDRPAFKTRELFSGTDEEKALAASGYLHYAGPFEVDEKEVRHSVELSLFPNWIHSWQRRRYRFHPGGQRMELYTGPFIAEGGRQTAHLIWDKLPLTYSPS